MYSQADLTIEIEKLIQSLMLKGQKLVADWITLEIIKRHKAIKGKDTDFYRLCTRAEVRDQVRTRLNSFKEAPTKKPQKEFVFEGYERLHKYYLIEEDGEQVGVAVQNIPSVQRRAIAANLRKMGAGCYQHADEMDRFDAEHNDHAAAAS